MGMSAEVPVNRNDNNSITSNLMMFPNIEFYILNQLALSTINNYIRNG